MSAPDRAEAVVLGWARTYTRGLHPLLAQRRIDELTSDCFEQRHWGAQVGASPVAVATSMVARTLAGVPADLLWRSSQLATARDRSPNPGGRPMGRWMKDNWWLGLATLAGTMFTAAGVMAPFEGEVEGGLPWWGGMLVMLAFGGLLLGGVWFRRRRRAAGDWLIVVGALPLFPLFWTIVLPLWGLAIVIPAIRDAADAASTGIDGTDGSGGRDPVAVWLLALLLVATAGALVVGDEPTAYALVAPTLAALAAHLAVRPAGLPRLRQVGLTALVAAMFHGVLTGVVVFLGDPGIIDVTEGLPSLSLALAILAGIVGLALLAVGNRPRDRARPA